MGVPSYFSYIIKNHNKIIKKIFQMRTANIRFKRLYMDCNSILYDSFHSISASDIRTMSLEKFEDTILEKTKLKIEEYINKIQPSDILYIAFDGVAPFAKMDQQRNRRYKSWFQTKILVNEKCETTEKKTTSMFTPGTSFMKKLSHYMTTAFSKQEKHYKIKEIILATPEMPGEGEHKLYEHLRQNPIKNNPNSEKSNIAIYGLDADLIMLSLFHLYYCENIYVFREAPEFMKNALNANKHDTDIEDELWGLDIAQLGRSISNEMRCSCPDNHRMYDYVFLCFLLGNDFLPHFPALNIRTNGIQRLLDIYRNCIGNKPKCYLLSETMPPTIQWNEVSKLMMSLAKQEHGFILQEYAIRKKWGYRTPETLKTNPDKEKEEAFQNAPVIFREEEIFITPSLNGWEDRYYSRFFSRFSEDKVLSEKISENPQIKYDKKEICINYLEGLEWVCKYYTTGCPDWNWRYKYNYPPLLVDLAPYVPHHSTTFIKTNTKMFNSFSPYVQLAYVLPISQLHLLPKKHMEWLLQKYSDFYPEKNIKFQWAFCRYFWESHICLPEMSEEILEKLDNEFRQLSVSV